MNQKVCSTEKKQVSFVRIFAIFTTDLCVLLFLYEEYVERENNPVLILFFNGFCQGSLRDSLDSSGFLFFETMLYMENSADVVVSLYIWASEGPLRVLEVTFLMYNRL